MENPNEPKKSKFSEQPHYFQWGLTAFCVIGCCVLVAFVLIKLPFIWNVVKKLVRRAQSVYLRLCHGVSAHAGL